MAENRIGADDTRPSVLRRVYNALFTVFGPAQITPYGEARAVPVADTPCSICGLPTTAHTVERTAEISRLRCPRPAPDEDTADATA